MQASMLPRGELTVTAADLKAIAAIEEFKGRWQATAALAPQRLQSLQRLALIESAGASTRIEGAQLSDHEVEQLLLENLQDKVFKTRDEQEVASYVEVMDMVGKNYTAIAVNENHIRQLHAVMLKYSVKDEHHRGAYKKTPNHVEAFDAHGKSKGIIYKNLLRHPILP